MFDNLLMSMNSKLKKIMSGLETNEGKIDEISTDVGSVGTSIATVQSTSDEIKALIGTEIATQLSALEANVIAAMPSNSTKNIYSVSTGSTVLKKIVSSSVSATSTSFTTLGTCKVTGVCGQVTIRAVMYNYYSYVNGGISAVINGVTYENILQTDAESSTTLTCAIPVSDGDVIEFILQGNNTNTAQVYCTSLQIRGTLEDGAPSYCIY